MEETNRKSRGPGRPLIAAMASLLVVCAQSRGEFVSDIEVAAAAETFVRHVTAQARPDVNIERVEPYVYRGEVAAYIVHLAGGGFCFCGADYMLEPVYLYNPDGTFDPEIPDYQAILRRVGKSRQHVTELSRRAGPAVGEKLAARAAKWLDLIEGWTPEPIVEDLPVQHAPGSMSLGLTAMWHQGRSGPTTHSRYDTFNQMCPVLTPATYADPGWTMWKYNEHCIVGCPATAICQVMYYWQWPQSGTGSETTEYPYRWWPTYSSTSMRVSVDPAQCIPDANWPWGGRLEWSGNTLVMKGYWDKSMYDYAMKRYDGTWSEQDIAKYQEALTSLYDSAPNSATEPYTENFGAATYRWDLMTDEWDAGLPDESKDAMRLISYHAGVAIKSDYGIRGSGSDETRTRDGIADHLRCYTDAEVRDTALYASDLASEIQWLRPVLLRGTDPNSGGHWWVVYGYDAKTSQFQMNMGWGEGHHSVWHTLSDPNLEYVEDQKHIRYIAPRNVKFVGAGDHGDGSPDRPYEDIEEALFGGFGAPPVMRAPDGSTLIFKAGTVNTFAAETLVIDRPLTLKGCDVIIRRQ